MEAKRQKPGFAEAIRIVVPEIEAFIITLSLTMESEKKALSCGIDAVFRRGSRFRIVNVDRESCYQVAARFEVLPREPEDTICRH
jgi:hypothetical protein